MSVPNTKYVTFLLLQINMELRIRANLGMST
jgi:hypothetical protein